MNTRYLTVSEVADYLKLPGETVYKYARSGRIPASKVGRYWRFDQARIDEWVKEHSNQPTSALRTIVVDDDLAVRSLLTRWLEDLGCEVTSFGGGGEAIQAVQEQECDLLFLDLMMPAPGGVEVLAQIKQIRPDLDVVIVTAYFDSRMMEEASELGPLTILKKPVDKDALAAVLSGLRVSK